VVPVAYGKYGSGVEFFPMSSRITAFSMCMREATCRWTRRTAAVRMVEQGLGWPGLTSVYTRVGNVGGGGNDVAEDVVGVIQYEFVDWRERKPAGADS
jgi:multidrug efflux pump